MLGISTVYAVRWYLSVRLSVVTFVHSVETNKHIIFTIE